MDYINKIICGDCLEVMKGIPDKSVDMILTSPPYDNLRDYKGYTFNFEGIAQEIYRVLKDGGVCVWIVGDATIKGSETGTSFKQALYFKEIGFNLFDTIIYQKRGGLMTGSIKGYSQKFEYMFVFSKGKPRSTNLLLEKTLNPGGKRGTYRQPDGRLKAAFHQKPTGETKVRGAIWYYCSGGTDIGHPAPFPEALARDHIISWSNPGDTVLDPFLGSGTTGKMAVLWDRNFIGIEIAEEYLSIAQRRIAAAQMQPRLEGV